LITETVQPPYINKPGVLQHSNSRWNMKQQDPGQDSKPERKTAYTDELLAEETKKNCQPSKSSGRALE